MDDTTADGTGIDNPDIPVPYWPVYYTATAPIAAAATPPESIPYWPVPLAECDIGPGYEWHRELQAEAG